MPAVPDDLLPARVLPLLRGRLGRPYRFEPVCASTQRLLGADDPEGSTVAADEQTEGRGRLGRRWESPPGVSLMASVLLRPDVATERLPELMPLAGEAVAETLEALLGIDAEVKFPNDVLLGGRKVAGVLAEASGGRVVLGLGVNVRQREHELPAEPRLPATSLLLAAGEAPGRAELLAEVLHRLERRYDAWR